MDDAEATRRADRLNRALIGTAIALVVFTTALYLVVGTGGTLLEIPWFGAFVLNLVSLTCLAASVLMLGRHRVLHDAAAYWAGIGFSAFGIALVFYVLAWPALLPDGTAILSTLPGTSAWFTHLAGGTLGGSLVAAALLPWPRGDNWPRGRWVASVGAWLAAITVVCTLVVALEQHLPTLVRPDGRFTPLLSLTNIGVAALLGVSIVLSGRYSRRTGDPLPAMAAFLPLAFATAFLWALIGEGRYSLWWYLARALLIAGSVTVLFGLLWEHVALMRRERARRKSLQEADRRKDEFLAMLSHELRNPLATITTVLYLLQARGAADPDIARAQEAAIRQSAHMRRLLDDLLDVSRITHGTIVLQRERLDLAALAAAALEAVRSQIEAKGLAFGTSLATAPIDGDAVRLTQAITNLLHNAVKYTLAGGEIQLAVWCEDRHAVLRVRDSGIGMDAELLRTVFDPFVQGNRAPLPGEGGLGIGLTVTRNLVEMHGGTVQAHSAGSGRGSEFVLRLPLAWAADTDAVAPPVLPPGRNRRVLVVEDDADALASLASLLELEGHEVRRAHSGEQALEEAARTALDVVLLDLGLPGIDGCETATRLRGLPTAVSATLVALTGYGGEADLARTRAAGFDHHLVKPVTLQSLRAVLGGRSPRVLSLS